MTIKIKLTTEDDYVELPEPVEVKLDYEPIVLYDKESITGKQHRVYERETNKVSLRDTLKFKQTYELDIIDIDETTYKALRDCDGLECYLVLQRGRKP
jgi:hypothetical protein